MPPNIEELQNQINFLKRECEDIRYLLNKKTGGGSADIKGKVVAPSTVTGSTVASASITKAQLSYETATLAFASGDSSKTATVTSGSIIFGVYSSTVTGTPVYGELQLSISGTTLTGTRSATPGGTAAITYTVVLIKA